MSDVVLDREGIEALLPHRDPMRLVDRVTALEAGVSIVAEHDVSPDAFWVKGHFPTEPVMPGVLIAEAMAQAAALVHLAAGDGADVVYLVGYDKLRFRQPVRPGDTLRLEARFESERRRLATFAVQAFVDDKRVASGTLMATLPG